MKARIPKHREFIINLAEDYEKKDECWDKLQEEYGFEYTVEFVQ